MSLDDPVLIYQSANNVFAFLVQIYLTGEGIEAVALDHGTVEHRAGQVWISRRDAASAIQKLQEYLERMHEQADAIETREDETIEAVCEECGETSTFHVTYFGSVQECFHCRSYLDVGQEEDSWWDEAEGLEGDEE
jgi:hypothetical protein